MVQKCPSQLICLPPPLPPVGLSTSSSSSCSLCLLLFLLVSLPPPLPPGFSASSSSCWSLYLLFLLLVSLPPPLPPVDLSTSSSSWSLYHLLFLLVSLPPPLPAGLSASSSCWSLCLLFLLVSPPPEVLLSLPGRGVKVEDILQDNEVLTSFLLRDVPLTQSVVYHLVKAQIRPEQVTSSSMLIIESSSRRVCHRRLRTRGPPFIRPVLWSSPLLHPS